MRIIHSVIPVMKNKFAYIKKKLCLKLFIRTTSFIFINCSCQLNTLDIHYVNVGVSSLFFVNVICQFFRHAVNPSSRHINKLTLAFSCAHHRLMYVKIHVDTTVCRRVLLLKCNEKISTYIFLQHTKTFLTIYLAIGVNICKSFHFVLHKNVVIKLTRFYFAKLNLKSI